MNTNYTISKFRLIFNVFGGTVKLALNKKKHKVLVQINNNLENVVESEFPIEVQLW